MPDAENEEKQPDEEQQNEEPEINAVAVNLADLVEDDFEDEEAEESEAEEVDEPEPEPEEEKEGGGGALGDIMDDIYADEQEEDERLKAFGDLEHLTMVEVTSEVEAVLEELRIRQGGYE